MKVLYNNQLLFEWSHTRVSSTNQELGNVWQSKLNSTIWKLMLNSCHFKNSYLCLVICTLTSCYLFYFLTVAIIYQALKAQLEEKKPTLEDAQGLCDKLTDQNKDEPLVVAAIKNKLDKVESPYEDLRAKITELEGRLQAAQIRSQEFDVSFSDFKDKLQDMEELTANLQPVSAVYDTLKQQRSDDEVHVKSQQNTVQFPFDISWTGHWVSRKLWKATFSDSFIPCNKSNRCW